MDFADFNPQFNHGSALGFADGGLSYLNMFKHWRFKPGLVIYRFFAIE